MFISENLAEILGQLILNCYVQDYKVLLGLTSNLVNGKIISNDDKIFELMNYMIGSIKCFTQTNKEVQRMTVQNQMISILSKALNQTMEINSFKNQHNKQSMILVQITGALRNLANVEDSYGLLLHC